MRSFRTKIAMLALLGTVTLTATGCEDDDKQVAADILNAVGSGIGHAMEKAPSGEDIVDFIDEGADAVGEVVGSVVGTLEKNSENHTGAVSDILIPDEEE